jgi:hypothetical protein
MQNHVKYLENPSQGRKEQQPIGDYIDQLPSDASVPSHNEIIIVDKFFQQKKSIFDKIFLQTKDIIIIGCLFILFSLPFVDNLIKKFIKITETSPYILIGIKALLFVIIYFFIKNIYLARKN